LKVIIQERIHTGSRGLASLNSKIFSKRKKKKKILKYYS